MITHTWSTLKTELLKVLALAGVEELVTPISTKVAATSAVHNKAQVLRRASRFGDTHMGSALQKIDTVDIVHRRVEASETDLDTLADIVNKAAGFLALNSYYTYAKTGIVQIRLLGTRNSKETGVLVETQSIEVRYNAPTNQGTQVGRNW